MTPLFPLTMKPGKSRLIFIPTLLVLMFFGPAVSAQTGEVDSSKPLTERKTLPQNGGRVERIAMARQMMAQGAFISAVNLLENIYADEPDNRDVINMMLACYMELKVYPKAEMLLQRQLDSNPTDYAFQSQLLDVYIQIGQDSLIRKQTETILERFPGNRDIYFALIRPLIRNGYPEMAMNLIEQARREYRDDKLFLLEAASILEIRRRYYDAVMEYNRASRADSVTAAEADRRTALLIRYPDAPEEVVRALKAILDENPRDEYALKFLSEAYIQQGRYPDAFASVIRLDSLSGGTGHEVIDYLRRCRDRHLHRQVVDVAEYIIRHRADSTAFSGYRHYYAEALVGLGRYREAMAAYSYIADSLPQARERAEALLKIGNIYRYNLRQYDSALVFYDSVSRHYRIGGVDRLARVERALMALVQGDVDMARDSLSKFRDDRLLTNYAEFIDFRLAMIDFFAGEFDAADMQFRKIMEAYPRGFYLNDALIHSLIIRESQLGFEEVLGEYAEAGLFEYRQMIDSAIGRLRGVIERGETPLVGTAIYRLAEIFIGRADTAAALALVERIAGDYPEDYFLPYCLKIKADIFGIREDRREEAADIYKTLLEKYGHYPFVGEVRESLQRLIGYLPAG